MKKIYAHLQGINVHLTITTYFCIIVRLIQFVLVIVNIVCIGESSPSQKHQHLIFTKPPLKSKNSPSPPSF